MPKRSRRPNSDDTCTHRAPRETMPASSRARTTRRGGGAASAATAQGVEGDVLPAFLDSEHAAEVRATDKHEMDIVYHSRAHGARKGSSALATSGTTCPPSLTSVFHRGKWSLGNVKDIYMYWQWAAEGDTSVARADRVRASGLARLLYYRWGVYGTTAISWRQRNRG